VGQLYIVHRVSPPAIERVQAGYERTPDLDWAGAMRLFKELGRTTPPDSGASSWDEYEELFESERWNLVLLLASSEALWDLDKSLDRPGDGLPGIAALLPALSPVKHLLSAMESFESSSVSDAFAPYEMGLMGIAPPEAVAAALSVAVEYSTPEARARIGAAPVPFFKRALGGGAALSSWQKDDYLWGHWPAHESRAGGCHAKACARPGDPLRQEVASALWPRRAAARPGRARRSARRP
jgi:hypothetical protein